ncbi:biopolymer transporter ExbD [Pseudoxanthomonas gei]|uniref:Biopolymer transporter ExbD n=1 Tax=Pseudoxanthomonas gei TaxID=1383030 RepID=A0ABX0AH54_9GAMM|nr:biopolymer transporter ExbD [Pseudoxanthomonas gei]NDK38846.1 biopolymer transporter ExbD [Pseudoxanthomonas gei]
MAFSAAVRDSAVAEMNITPLVDVMLVLLVIFMVSAPLVSSPVSASLPQSVLRPVTPTPLQLQLTVAADGSYRLDDRPLAPDQLWERLEDALVSDPQATLRVDAESDAHYQNVVTALAHARRIGITRISIQP